MSDTQSFYLDESGDLGFKFENQGTPRYFVITILACKSKSTIDQFKNAVRKTLKNKVNPKVAGSREFKGTHTELTAKKYFYRQIESLNDWHVYGIVLDKYKYKNKIKILPRESEIYNYLSKTLLMKIDLSDIKSRFLLVADKRNQREASGFTKYISSYLDGILPKNFLYSVIHEDSHKDPLLQSVDLFCWGIRKYYEHQDKTWFSLYENRLTLIEADDILRQKKDGP